jgi:chromosome segregation ATPase
MFTVHRTSPFPNHLPQQNSTLASPRDTNRTSESELEKQITELQAQLLQLRNESQKIQDALKEATGIRHAKEGEVSILRKNIEKVSTLLQQNVCSKLKSFR